MKDKKCKVCQTKFTPVQFAQAVCNYKCAIEHSKKLKQLKEQREWKAEKAILRDKLKTLSQYEAEAKKSFQKWVRMRDEKQPCISCGVEYTDQIEEKANETRNYKFAKCELIAKKLKYDILIKEFGKSK